MMASIRFFKLFDMLANSGMHEPDTIRLISCLLDYCALTTEAASDKFDEAPRDTTRPDRLS